MLYFVTKASMYQDVKVAKLYFYYSAMNAGKTTKLLQSSFNYNERGMDTILYTFRFDNRFGESKIASRIGLAKNSYTYDSNTSLFNDIKSKIGKKTKNRTVVVLILKWHITTTF